MVSSGSNRSRAAASARDELSEFLVDYGEQLLVADPAGDERRDPPKGGLLGNDLLQVAIDLGRLAGAAGTGGRGLRCFTRHAGSVAFRGHGRVSESPAPVPSPHGGCGAGIMLVLRAGLCGGRVPGRSARLAPGYATGT